MRKLLQISYFLVLFSSVLNILKIKKILHMKQLLYILLLSHVFTLTSMEFKEYLDDYDEDDPSCCCFLTTVGAAFTAGLFTTKNLMSYLPNEKVFPATMGIITAIGVCTTANELYYTYLDCQNRKNKKKTD